MSNVEGSYMNGIFVCKFTRQKMIDGDEKAFDLNNDYYMMVATGKAYGGMILLLLFYIILLFSGWRGWGLGGRSVLVHLAY